MSQLYIGIMSGTSADGIDLALVDVTTKAVSLVNSLYIPYDDKLKSEITSLYLPSNDEIDRLGKLDVKLAKLFADATNELLAKANVDAINIAAIGNHGQTVRHRPEGDNPFTLQICCNQTLAVRTGIRVVGDFRTKDMALGGQGAPLVPAFHKNYLANPAKDVCVVNVGGMANITFMPRSGSTSSILGFDTGPGNALLDDWFQQHNTQAYDDNGEWAKQGCLNQSLLTEFLSDPYFSMPSPKSTGREYFHLDWIKRHTAAHNINPQDVQTTLTHLTAITISDSIKKITSSSEVLLCGGGYRNGYLVDLIKENLKNHEIFLTNQRGMDPDLLESIAFAWLAFAYDKKIYSSIPDVTGASKATTLGTAFFP